MIRCVRFFAVLVLLLVASRAGAEPVTYQFTGQISSFGGSLNLSSLFSIGDAVTIDVTVERTTTPEPEDAYVTAYSTLEEDVFVAPCVVTTNDNFMGRTEKRLAAMKGPTIRRGARVGGGAILCPGIEVGEEAFVGAGAVVTKDVPPRVVVVGNPARVLRDVPEDELLSP